MSTAAPSRVHDSHRAIDASDSWQRSLRTAIRDPIRLCQAVQLDPHYHQPAVRAALDFPVFAPLAFVAKMKKGDVHDPLLRQVLPLAEEFQEVPGYNVDPVGDLQATISPGAIQKYHGRVLLVTTGACPVHCRYCFRRHYPYQGGPRSLDSWRPALEQIESDSTIEEVILSGGDPLTLADTVLGELVQHLSHIAHLRRLRIHTRFPVMVPQRIDDQLLAWLSETRLSSVIVLHANHPAELDDLFAAAASRLIAAGASLLNQSVLLRGVNDNVETLVELSRRLVDMRVMPYYLHQLDRVAGASHFEVPVAEGKRFIHQLRASLPGYAVPRYVREDAGQPNKTILV